MPIVQPYLSVVRCIKKFNRSKEQRSCLPTELFPGLEINSYALQPRELVDDKYRVRIFFADKIMHWPTHFVYYQSVSLREYVLFI